MSQHSMETNAIRPGLGIPLLLAILASSILAQKSPEIRLDSAVQSEHGVRQPQIVASGDSVYVTWWDGRTATTPFFPFGDIYFNRSRDGGATWLPSEVRLNQEPSSSGGIAGIPLSERPEIAAANDRVYVVWPEVRDQSFGIFFNSSQDGGETWLPSDIRIDPNSQGYSPGIAARDNFVFVTWTDRRNGDPNIYFNRSSDGGITWLPTDIRLTADLPGGFSRSARCPRVLSCGDSIYVTWHDSWDGSHYRDIYFNRSLDNGSTWLSSDLRLNSDPLGHSTSQYPQIAAAGDAVYVTWWDTRSHPANIYFNRSLDRGGTWMPSDVRLDRDLPLESSAFQPQITASGNSVYAAWTKRDQGNSDIYFNRSLDSGSTWLSHDIRLDTDLPAAGDSQTPQITAFGESVYVTWSDSRNGDNDIYFNRSLDGGITWLPSDIRLESDFPGVDYSATPSIESSGESVYVTWSDGFELLFNIPFGAQPFGEGTAGSNAIVPILEGTDSLTLGSTFTLSVTDGLGGAFGLLLLGGPDSKTAIPMLGGSLLIDPIQQVVPIRLKGAAGVAGDGSYSVAIPIPDENVLLGFNVNLQALLLDPGAPGSIALTNGVEAWIL